MTNQLKEQSVAQEVVTEEVVATEVVSEIPFLDSVDEAKVEELKSLSHEEIIARLDKNQKDLEQQIADKNKAFDELQQQMERTNFITKLANEGLSEFAGLFEIKDVNEQVAFIKNAVNEILVRHSYQPKEVAQQEQYTQAINEGNVEKALGFKLSKFFGK